MIIKRVDLTSVYNEQASVRLRALKRAVADTGRSPYVR
jgi:hypothetical protein